MKNTVVGSTNKKDSFYNSLKEEKVLLLSIDPGYDAYKIYVNGRPFICKSLVTKAYNFANGLRIKNGALVKIDDTLSGITSNYAVGEPAYMLVSNRDDESESLKENLKNAYTDAKRFSTEEFKASFYGALVYTLYQYAQVDNEVGFTLDDLNRLNDWKFGLMLTVPYNYSSEAQSSLSAMLNAPANVRVQVSFNMCVTLHDALNCIFCEFQPQVLAAFRGKYFTNFGTSVEEAAIEQLDGELPGLIIDAGYHTCAIVYIDEMYGVYTGKSKVTDEDYSMEHFDRLTADLIKEEYGERIPEGRLSPALISEYCSGKRKLYEETEDGNRHVDVKKYREKVLEEEMVRLKAYLKRKFNMSSLQAACITGGTGEGILYDFLRNALKSWENIEDINLIKGRDLNGQDVGAVYGVSYGGYTLLTVQWALIHEKK